MICAYIDHYMCQFGVEPICRVLTEHDVQIAPSSYYAHRRRPVTDALRAEAVLVNVVMDLHRKNRDVYGIRKMWHAMTQAGYQVGRDQVARLMGIAGVRGISRGQHITTTTPPRERWGALSGGGPDRPELDGVDQAGPVVGRGLHVCLDAGRVLLHLVRCRCLFQAHFGVASVDDQDNRARHVGGRAGPFHPPTH